jgi:NAD(P)-dependent dehydrogenase (short-subunit alcohol dehydrogenase family)
MKLFDLASLNGRRVLLTGAAGGLGKVFADTLAELGAELILVDRKGSALPQLAEELARRYGCQPQLRFCDLESQEERQSLITELRAQGKLSVLINNAAFVGTSELQGWGVPFEQQTLDAWRRALEVNLTAVFHLCQGLAPVLKQSPGASIINLGSIYGSNGPDWGLYTGTSMSNPAAYSASKGGLLQLTRWLATTMAPAVRVNAISPGGIARGQAQVFVERYDARTPLGRMATENDFRGVVAFLASDLSAYMTGQNLSIDGGWGVW